MRDGSLLLEQNFTLYIHKKNIFDMNSNFTGFSIIPDDKLSETDKQIQLALGFGLGKRAFYNGEEHYYLNDNEIVKFDRYDQTFRNTKFLINEQEKRHYRFCPWIAHAKLLAKYHRATVQEEGQVTYTPKFGSEAFHL